MKEETLARRPSKPPVEEFPSHKLERFIVRLPDGMRDYIKAEAEKNGRSMNAEIVHRLELTRRFDLDVGEFERTRSQLGPIADFIEEQISGVRLDLSDLRVDLGLDFSSDQPSKRRE